MESESSLTDIPRTLFHGACGEFLFFLDLCKLCYPNEADYQSLKRLQAVSTR